MVVLNHRIKAAVYRDKRLTELVQVHFTDLGILIDAVLSATPALNLCMDCVSCSPVSRLALSTPPLGSYAVIWASCLPSSLLIAFQIS